MSRQRIVIVDDEPLARGALRDLLGRDSEVQVVGEAEHGAEALEVTRRLKPDILFLDVEMPGMTGVEVAEQLGEDDCPIIVFVTAYGEFAIRAFDVQALDYVVKPFSDDRLFAALERAKSRARERRLSRLAKAVAEEAAEIDRSRPRERADDGYLTRIPIRSGGKSKLLATRDLVWIESQDYYARLHTPQRSYLVRTSLAKFEDRLDPKRFLRIHRQAIVNLDHVVAVEHLPAGAQSIVLSTGDRCRVSRSRRAQVKEALLPRV